MSHPLHKRLRRDIFEYAHGCKRSSQIMKPHVNKASPFYSRVKRFLEIFERSSIAIMKHIVTPSFFHKLNKGSLRSTVYRNTPLITTLSIFYPKDIFIQIYVFPWQA